jgi:biotin-dependent enzyme/HEAT repeat protein
MTENGNNPNVAVAAPAVARLRASWPLLILALVFVFAAFLTWYFTWFGRELSDSDISQYLSDEKHPRHVQHALLQIQQRIEREYPNAKQWYPRILGLADNPETEFRLTVAWLMGCDHKSEEFHSALLKLLHDQQPIVRRNAALALVRFNDSSGREELRATLQPYPVTSPAKGFVTSTLHEGSQIARGSLLARIKQADNKSNEVRSPLSGQVEKVLAPNGAEVMAGSTVLTIRSDQESLWEALRALSIIGQAEDLPDIEHYAQGTSGLPDRIKQQASLTAKSIQSRSAQQKPESRH